MHRHPPVRPRGPRAARSLATLCVAVGLALPATAQLGMHPMPEGPRGMAERLAEADVVVIARVAALSPDRIELERLAGVRGTAPQRFAVKRSPSRSPKLHPGQRALWLLQGARAPYVLVDTEKEFLRLGEEDPAPWVRAVRELDGAPDRDAQRAVYLRWIDGEEAALRQAALEALRDVQKMGPAPPGLAVDRARVALDPSVETAVREASALIAIGSPDGARAMTAGMPPAGEVGAALVPLVLQAAAMHQVEGRDAAVLRCLADDRSDIRLAAIDAARLAWTPDIAAALKRLADEDPSEAVRRKAASARPPDPRASGASGG